MNMNLKTFLAAVQVAKQAGTKLPLVLFVFQLLKQFDRSLIKANDNDSSEPAEQAGYVYVIRDKANGERYKSGYRAIPPWRDSQLRSQMGQLQDFVLIIPAKDAKALEKKLRQSYAGGGRKGAWFTLSNNKQREILIIAALVMVAAGDALGMAPVSKEILELGKELFNRVTALASSMLAILKSTQTQSSAVNGPSEAEPDFDGFSAISDFEISDFDWNWESVLNKDYYALPKLRGKEAYLSVIRDNDAKEGRIFFDDHPAKSLETAFVDRSLRFALEIVLILKVDNKRKARRVLLSSSGEQDGNEWVALSDDMLGEIKKFATAEWHGDSIYVGPRTHFGLETLSPVDFRTYPKLEDAAGYVCVVQGVKPGNRWKIWSSRRPKRWTRRSWRARELNSPQALVSSSKLFRFSSLIQAEHAQSFRRFLRARYRQQRRKGGWFELDDAQLEEIRKMGRKPS